MADLIVRLYALDPALTLAGVTELANRGVTIRRALSPERRPLIAWVAGQFGDGWAGETEVALSHTPTTVFVALRSQEILGFACFDTTALGFFGPTGVAEAARGAGIGAALLRATLSAMRDTGYAYAVIGGAGPVDFYARTVGAMPIPDSTPGIYAGLLRPASAKPKEPNP